MSATFIVAAAFAVLLALEWRYRRRPLREGTALMALAVLFYFQPNCTWARRRALGTPSSDRVTLNPVGAGRDTLSEYHRGVYTTMDWVAYSDASCRRPLHGSRRTLLVSMLAGAPASARPPRAWSVPHFWLTRA